MKNRFEMIEIINSFIDIENYISTSFNREDWFVIHTNINEELRKKNYIGEHQNIYFSFGFDGKIENIHLQIDTRADEEGVVSEKFEDSDGNEVTVTRRPYKDPKEVFEATNFDLNLDEWKNYKRTKLIDKMLNER